MVFTIVSRSRKASYIIRYVYIIRYMEKKLLTKKHKLLIQVSQVQKLMKLKELSLPTVAEELRQQSFWRCF